MTRRAALDTLDDFLMGVRRLLQRPGYRRRFLARLGEPVVPGTLRAVRGVQRLQQREPCMSDLAAILVIDASTATRLVDQAVAAGYLERRPSSGDQRRTALVITPTGHTLLTRANAVRRELLAEVTTDWSEEDLDALARLLGRLTIDLDRLDQP